MDFAIYVPFVQRALKASKFRSFVLMANGYVTGELPGPANFTQWRMCYRLLKMSLLMLDAVGLASLQAYENTVERLSRTFPSCWHLIYSADEVARSAQANRTRSRVLMDIKAGQQAPEGFSVSRPWDCVFGALARDEGFWQAQDSTSINLDRIWKPRYAKDTCGATGFRTSSRWPQRNLTSHGELLEHEGFEHTRRHPETKTKVESRSRLWRKPKAIKGIRYGKRKGKRKPKGREQTEVFQLEQWKWGVWFRATRPEMCGTVATTAQVHDMRLSRSPQQGLHQEGPMKMTATGQTGDATAGPKQETTGEAAASSAEYTYTYETEEEKNMVAKDMKIRKKTRPCCHRRWRSTIRRGSSFSSTTTQDPMIL